MKFRTLILVLTVTFSVIFVSMLGSSYAYYIATGGTNINVTTADIDPDVAVVFNQSQYINMSTGIPIAPENVDKMASSSIFTLSPNGDVLKKSDVAVTISIINLSVDSDLRIDDFKYKLTCDDGNEERDLIIGTGADFTDDILSKETMVLGTLSTIDGTFDIYKDYTCTLRIWLQETNDNQNALMNKKFTGLIKVNTLFRG